MQLFCNNDYQVRSHEWRLNLVLSVTFSMINMEICNIM